MPPVHASSIPKQSLLTARAEGAQVTALHQQDVQVGSQGQRLGTGQVTITSLVATTGNASSGGWHLWAQNIPEPKSTALDRGAGASLIPGRAVGTALGAHSLPSLVHSIPSLDN